MNRIFCRAGLQGPQIFGFEIWFGVEVMSLASPVIRTTNAFSLLLNVSVIFISSACAPYRDHVPCAGEGESPMVPNKNCMKSL